MSHKIRPILNKLNINFQKDNIYMLIKYSFIQITNNTILISGFLYGKR